jgi:hypothetical protein
VLEARRVGRTAIHLAEDRFDDLERRRGGEEGGQKGEDE